MESKFTIEQRNHVARHVILEILLERDYSFYAALKSNGEFRFSVNPRKLSTKKKLRVSSKGEIELHWEYGYFYDMYSVTGELTDIESG